jgi:hypothetical protein
MTLAAAAPARLAHEKAMSVILLCRAGGFQPRLVGITSRSEHRYDLPCREIFGGRLAKDSTLEF